jgi:hypothetical protein
VIRVPARSHNLSLFVIILILTHLTLVACSGEKWKLIKIDNSNMEALFPLIPLQESGGLNYIGVGKIKANMASLDHDEIEYMIVYQETFTDTYIYTKESLYPGFMIKIGAEIYEKKYITLGLLEGVEYKMNVNEKKSIVQMFPDSNKIYNIIVIFPESKFKDAEKFIESVHIN